MCACNSTRSSDFVDVETVRNLPQSAIIAQNYFTPAESGRLGSSHLTALRDALFDLWTHKEAIVKGRGVGLAGNLGHAEFEIDPLGTPQLVAWAATDLQHRDGRSGVFVRRRAMSAPSPVCIRSDR